MGSAGNAKRGQSIVNSVFVNGKTIVSSVCRSVIKRVAIAWCYNWLWNPALESGPILYSSDVCCAVKSSGAETIEWQRVS